MTPSLVLFSAGDTSSSSCCCSLRWLIFLPVAGPLRSGEIEAMGSGRSLKVEQKIRCRPLQHLQGQGMLLKHVLSSGLPLKGHLASFIPDMKVQEH